MLSGRAFKSHLWPKIFRALDSFPLCKDHTNGSVDPQDQQPRCHRFAEKHCYWDTSSPQWEYRTGRSFPLCVGVCQMKWCSNIMVRYDVHLSLICSDSRPADWVRHFGAFYLEARRGNEKQRLDRWSGAPTIPQRTPRSVRPCCMETWPQAVGCKFWWWGVWNAASAQRCILNMIPILDDTDTDTGVFSIQSQLVYWICHILRCFMILNCRWCNVAYVYIYTCGVYIYIIHKIFLQNTIIMCLYFALYCLPWYFILLFCIAFCSTIYHYAPICFMMSPYVTLYCTTLSYVILRYTRFTRSYYFFTRQL